LIGRPITCIFCNNSPRLSPAPIRGIPAWLPPGFALAMAAFLLLAPFPAGADDPIPTQEQRQAELDKLNWISAAGHYQLTQSHSHIDLPDGYYLLLGADAARYDTLSNGVDASGTEAVVFNNADHTAVYFVFYDKGFVKDDDWSEVNADEFLKQMQEQELKHNSDRVRQGVDYLLIDGWKETPRYDGATHTAYWATSLSNAMNRWINASAVRLARNGYHYVIWVGDESTFTGSSNSLATVMGLHDYDDGYRYADHVDGDKLAGFGIGALAASILGVKFGGGFLAGLLGGVLFYGKKILVMVALIVGGFTAWKVRARRKAAALLPPAAPPPPPNPPAATR
jgi:uncharacterized membrane-anchored protein